LVENYSEHLYVRQFLMRGACFAAYFLSNECQIIIDFHCYYFTLDIQFMNYLKQ